MKDDRFKANAIQRVCTRLVLSSSLSCPHGLARTKNSRGSMRWDGVMFAVEATRDGQEVKVAFLRQCLQQLRTAYPTEQGWMTAVPHDDYSEAEQLRVYAPVEEKMAAPPPLRVLGAAPNPTHTLPFQIPR